MAKQFDRVTVTAHAPVAVLAFNQPEVMNAVSAPMIAGAMEALDHIQAEGFHALVLTATGKAFCAGANLAEVEPGLSAGDMLEKVYHPFLRRLRDFPMPAVAA